MSHSRSTITGPAPKRRRTDGDGDATIVAENNDDRASPLEIEPCSMRQLEDHVSLLEFRQTELTSEIDRYRGRILYLKEQRRAKLRRCSVEGCDNFARTHHGGGLTCMRHGASKTVRLCDFEGCTNHAKKGGLCKRHGAKKYCVEEGCSNVATSEGWTLCYKHAGKCVPICSTEGCKNIVKKGGACKRHMSREDIPTCHHPDGCTNQVWARGMCATHDREDRGIVVAMKLLGE